MSSRSTQQISSLFQQVSALLVDLGAAAHSAFNGRRFSCGFWLGWFSAYSVNTLFVLYVLQDHRLRAFMAFKSFFISSVEEALPSY